MRIPISWLNELLSKPVEPHAAEAALTRVGLEVEALSYFAPGLEKVVVGQIIQIEPHPNADKLRICQTDIGESKPTQIVTGAQNVKLNDKIPVALVGALLPGNKAINAAKLRGVESFGMYCSTVELGLPVDVDGVHVLPEGMPIGQAIADAMHLGELVLDLSILANRPDAMSVIGVARELAVALPDVSLVMPHVPELPQGAPGTIKLGAIDAAGCPFYAGFNLKGIKVASSPEWLVKRLEASGLRAINNVVDATNYIMLLTGQPLHAFDTAKIKGQEIHVRCAFKDEVLVTLDGVERCLTPEDLVVADKEGALVVAGIMGGADAGVSETTANLFLEAAYFTPSGVRLTGRRLGLSTESSRRFERGVDPQGAPAAMGLLVELIVKLTGGTVEGGVATAKKADWPLVNRLSFRLDRIDRLLGIAIPNQEVERILKALGFGLERHSDGVFELNAYDVTVPGWRSHDVAGEADLVEEVGRHYGFDKVPALLPPGVKPPVQPHIDRLASRARQAALGLGLTEIVTNSLTSLQAEALAGLHAEAPITLANPLGDMAILRTSLLPGLLETLRYNRYQGQSRLGIFELARTYEQGSETWGLAGAVMGSLWEGMWLSEHTPEPLKANFAFAKGLLELLWQKLELTGDLTIQQSGKPHPSLHPGRCADVLLNGQFIGVVGELHPAVQEAYDLSAGSSISAFLLNISALSKEVEKTRRFVSFSRYPAILRDLAVVVPETVQAYEPLALIREEAGELLEEVVLFDRYQGAQVQAGQVSLGFSLSYRACDRTLSMDEVEPIQARILERLEARFGASLRR
jgi:phenylalanyl-tRNA synthetase beta chain